MTNISQALRHAARRLRRSAAFTTAASITLALGVAATATIFTVVNGVILRPLPYESSEALVQMDHVAPGIDLPGALGLSPGLYKYYRDRMRTISDIAIYRPDEATLTGEGAPQRIMGLATTASLFNALRVQPARGRWFTEAEAQEGALVIVLSHALWTTRFGSDPNIIGRRIQLDGNTREVIGVANEGLAYPAVTTLFYIPEQLSERQFSTVGGFNHQSIARLQGTSTVADVLREQNALIAGLKEAFPGDPVAQEAIAGAQLGGNPELLKDRIVGPVRQTLWILLGMVGLVLLIAGANVANLFLVRSEERNREVAVRRALGAGRGGIVGYFLAESFLLSLFGGVIGLLMARWGVQLLVQYGPENLPRMNEVAVDGVTVAAVVLLVFVASIAFALIPLMRRGGALASTLREGGRGSTAGVARFRTRNALMAGQVALAIVLLVASGLMVRSFMRLRAVDPGFKANSMLTFDVSLTGSDFPTRASAVAFHERVVERVRALPGVQNASAITCLPLSGSCWGDPLNVKGRVIPAGSIPPVVQLRRTMPEYFETMQIRLIKGRTIEPADHQQRIGSIVLSRRAAEQYFPNEEALGQQMTFMFDPESQTTWYTVVGVVEDTPVEQLGEAPFGLVYFPVMDPIDDAGSGAHSMAFTVRTTVPPMTLANAVRDIAAEINPNVAIGHIRTMDMIVANSSARLAFTMVLLLIAGSIAVVLGGVGIYGVISYVTGQRRNEIGVRMALGARPVDVSSMVLRQSGSVIAVGIAAGLVAALLLSRLLVSILFQVAPTDVVTYVSVTVFLVAVAALASWLPARRAAALDPLIALRSQ